MRRRRMIGTATVAVLVGMMAGSTPSGAIPMAPGERCVDTIGIEVCATMAVAGLVSASEHVPECRAATVSLDSTNDLNPIIGSSIPIATGIRTCQFYKNGAAFGPNLVGARPDAVTVLTGDFGVSAVGTYSVCLEGFVLYDNASETVVGAPNNCGPIEF